ncbi:MAG: cytochrome c [Terriglobales bacterium]
MLKRISLSKFALMFALTIVAAFLFACVLGAEQSPPSGQAPEQKAPPPEAAQKANPVKPTAESIAKGKKLYNIDCAMCHGEAGDGKNDMDMKNVPNLTTAEQQSASDGQWFYSIKNGKGDMPPEGARAKDDDVWNVVNYLRTLAKK